MKIKTGKINGKARKPNGNERKKKKMKGTRQITASFSNR